MLNDRQTQARNVIMQQVQVLLEELNTQDDKLSKLSKYNKEYELANKALRDAPDMDTHGWYHKRLSEAYAEKVTLKEDLKKWKEFGKLKDRAKIKVEQARDTYKAQAEYYADLVQEFRRKAHETATLREQNALQAESWTEVSRKNSELVRQNALLKAKVDKLHEIIESGIRGLRAEETRRQREGYW